MSLRKECCEIFWSYVRGEITYEELARRMNEMEGEQEELPFNQGAIIAGEKK